jgi:hypothetical protein
MGTIAELDRKSVKVQLGYGILVDRSKILLNFDETWSNRSLRVSCLGSLCAGAALNLWLGIRSIGMEIAIGILSAFVLLAAG